MLCRGKYPAQLPIWTGFCPMAAARATENQAMKTPRQLAGLMNSLPLSSNFEVCLRGGERLHNPVSHGMEEGKPLKAAPRCYVTTLDVLNSALILLFRAGSVRNRWRSAPSPAVSGWRGFKNGGCLRTSAAQANQPAAPATPTGPSGVPGAGFGWHRGAAYIEEPPFGIKISLLTGESRHFGGWLLTNSDSFGPNLTLTVYCDLEVFLGLTWVTWKE